MSTTNATPAATTWAIDTSHSSVGSTVRHLVISKVHGQFTVAGDLTIASTTKPVTLEVESLGGAKDPWGNQRLGYSAKTSIDRREFGLT